VAGHPVGYPVANWDRALSELAFPPIPNGPVEPPTQEHLRFGCWVSLFERLHALRPFEEVLMDLVSEEPALIRFLDRLEAYWHQVIDAALGRGVEVIMLADDWGTQTAAFVSTGLFSEHFAPRYQRLIARVHGKGRRVLFHCCGQPGGLLDPLLNLKFDIFWPQIGLYDYEHLTGVLADRRVTLLIHPDRQRLVPRGTPAEIDQTIARYAERHHALGGGGMFHVEIENDAPWVNVEALLNAIARYRY